MLEVKKQWHIHNIEQLTAQLSHENESIKNCEANIQLCQMALGIQTAELSN
jgi:hypothetical protein